MLIMTKSEIMITDYSQKGYSFAHPNPFKITDEVEVEVRMTYRGTSDEISDLAAKLAGIQIGHPILVETDIQELPMT